MKKRSNNFFACRRNCAGAVLLLAVTSVATAQDRGADPLEQARDAFRNAIQRVMIPTSHLTDGPQVRAAFREVIREPAKATVEVLSDGQRVAFGGIVGSDGWVLTKASQMTGSLECRLEDGREFDAQLVGVDRAFDLAMLKIDARGLPVLNLEREDDGDVGQWVATVGPQRDPVAVGVVSVDTREIDSQRGWLGIQLDTTTTDPRVTMVFEGSGAESAGILVNDLIVEVNNEPTPTREKLIREVAEYSPGDVIDLAIQRGSQRIEIRAVLTPPVKGMPTDRRDFQNRLGSELSERRFGFPQAFQHDTVLKPIDCGGPLVDLDGRVVGFNIARSGRTESYAIPSNVAVTRLYDLMSGNLAPEEGFQEAAASNNSQSPGEDQSAESEELEDEDASSETPGS